MTHRPTLWQRMQRFTHALLWSPPQCWDEPGELRENVVHLLTDARHWCDESGQDYATLDRLAYQSYLSEIRQYPVEQPKPIVIEVRGGVVQEVLNVPPGYEYEVTDYDDIEMEGGAA